jgi:pSer/pThr/pTyr-binding forkhead associated (FHA) protein
MAKLVLLSVGMTGRTHELKAGKTTIGRLEDNTFQVAEPSVSGHHCEVLVRANEVTVRDLNSTNGTYLSGEKISEAPMKPGQILRLGQVEMRLETDAPPATPKKLDQTMVMRRGVSLNELVEHGTRAGGFDTASSGFSKKSNLGSRIFWFAAGAFVVLLAGVIVYLILNNR